MGRLSQRDTVAGERHFRVSAGPAGCHPDGGTRHIVGLDPKLGYNGNGQIDGWGCRLSMQQVINILLILKVTWVVSLVAFFSFLAFHNVLSGKRLVGGILEPLTQCLYVSGIILSVINASRWPKGRCCAGRFSVSASAADEESKDDLGEDIDLPLTKNKEVELI